MRKRILAVILATVLLCATFTGCVKVVPLNSSGSASGSGNVNGTSADFDAQAYIKGVFQSKAVPELEKKAVDFTTLMTESKGDFSTVGAKYGQRADANSIYNFIVKGSAKVDDVKTELRAGYIVLKVDGYTGTVPVKMQVGPVFKGTSLRDSISFLKFDDFRNQVTFAALSTALHKQITDDLFSKIKPADLKGKTIEFSGTFANDGSGEILITPFELKTK
jgi:predicted lipoprotein